MPSKLRREVKTKTVFIKPTQDRVVECVSLLKQLNEKIGIPLENPSIKLLNRRMTEYYKHFVSEDDEAAAFENPIEGVIPLVSSNRSIHYRFPLRSDKFVEVWLKVDAGAGAGDRVYSEELKALMDAEE